MLTLDFNAFLNRHLINVVPYVNNFKKKMKRIEKINKQVLINKPILNYSQFLPIVCICNQRI